MASVRANLLISFLEKLSYGQAEEDPPNALERARRTLRLLTVPQLPGTRTIESGAPNVRAQWHVGSQILPDLRILYFHGGGYCAGSTKTHRHFTSTLARLTGMPVLSVDYRLAPENPYPAQIEDALRAWDWACANGPDGASPARKVFIAGDSAGGGLTLTLAQALRDRGGQQPAGCVMLSPWLDVSVTSDSVRRLAHTDILLTPAHGRRWSRYFRGDAMEDPKDPRVSPLYGDFSGLPPLYFCVGGREMVLDDTLDAIERAREAGVETSLDRNEEMFHVWPLFGHLIPEGRDSTQKIAQWLNRRR